MTDASPETGRPSTPEGQVTAPPLPSEPRKRGWLNLVLAPLALLAVGGLGVWGGMTLVESRAAKPATASTDGGDADAGVTDGGVTDGGVTDGGGTGGERKPAEKTPKQTLKGFQMGEVAPSEPVQQIRVTIYNGKAGDPIEEPVDLHLGLGFPLRLYPLGSDERDPAFAAFPQVSSLEPGENVLPPGGSATFTFDVKPDNDGQDELAVTPHLLSGLKAGDIHSIGFASQGNSNWQLQGYSIEVNGEMFASNDSVNQFAGMQQDENRALLDKLLPVHATLAQEVEGMQAYVSMLEPGASDRQTLSGKQKELAEISAPLNRLSGVLGGSHPWFVESSKSAAALKPGKASVSDLRVTLLTTGANAGSQNPVYFWAGGKKMLLSSEIDPLPDTAAAHRFQIGKDELAVNPLTLEDLKQVGVGMTGSDEHSAATPDRAKLQRVMVEADGRTVFDSDQQAIDRRILDRVYLTPPAHRAEDGSVVHNAANAREVHLWKSAAPLGPGEKPATTKTSVAGLPPIKPETKRSTLSNETPQRVRLALASLPPSVSQLAQHNTKAIPRLLAKPTTAKPTTAKPTGAKTPAGVGGTKPGASTPRRRNLYSPIRQLLSRLAGVSPVMFVLKSPPARQPSSKKKPASPKKKTPPALKLKPAPAKPNILNVRIAGGFQPLRDGDPVAVEWQTAGDTSNVGYYKVKLNAVLPHLKRPFVSQRAGGKPLAVPVRVDRGSPSRSVVRGVNIARAGVTGADQMYLYMQPEVSAFDSKDRLLVSASGPLVPLLPQDNQPSDLKPGPFGVAMDTAARTGALNLAPGGAYPGFQVDGDGFGHLVPGAVNANQWLPFKQVEPGTIDSAWPLNYTASSASALSFAGYSGSIATHSRATGEITVRFYQYPFDMTESMHLTGHIGFLGKENNTNSKAKVSITLTVSDAHHGRAAFGKATTNQLVGVIVPAPVTPPSSRQNYIASSELLRIDTTSPATIQKRQLLRPAPMQLIDIPVLNDVKQADYKKRLAKPAGGFNGKYDVHTNIANPSIRGFPVVPAAPGQQRYLTATISIKPEKPAGEAIAIFGLRLVPEVK